jgi:FlaA1/EpsC-like NDP-sugar epimerase
VVGFLDDNPDVRRRRVLGIKVLGGLEEAEELIRVARPDEVLVTIPAISPRRLEPLLAACTDANAPCRFVRREIEPARVLSQAPVE